jgi:putative N6-adenine-specific DNA methylase
MAEKKQRCFAIVAPGLETLAGTELSRLGVAVEQQVNGGVSFRATTRQLYAANLQLRTVSRIVTRVARFRATAFWELEKQASKLPWGDWIAAGREVEFSVTSHQSKLYHQRAIAERLFGAMAGKVNGVRPATSESAQLVLARLERDEVVISLDSSGDLLHQRGYRLATGKAPLRETLAAAMLLGAGWDGSTPLIDPFCGSGTIPIEAALIARRIPPGWFRGFGFEQWPGFDPAVWKSLRAKAADGILPSAPSSILGSDRDAGAVAAAAANAERAGVSHDISLACQALSRVEVPPGPGWLISNPPYGVRVGEANRLRDLYARLGQVARQEPGWSTGLLVSDIRLARHSGLELDEVWRSRNGGIPVRFVVAGEGVSG